MLGTLQCAAACQDWSRRSMHRPYTQHLGAHFDRCSRSVSVHLRGLYSLLRLRTETAKGVAALVPAPMDLLCQPRKQCYVAGEAIEALATQLEIAEAEMSRARSLARLDMVRSLQSNVRRCVCKLMYIGNAYSSPWLLIAIALAEKAI